MRPLLSIFAASSLLLIQTPVLAEGKADDIGVMSISLQKIIKSRLGIQGQTQGAGIPNEIGAGGFLPLLVGNNSVFYFDAQVNANFDDFNYYSSIVSTTVSGTTFSTSSRLGYRWLNRNRSWMYGINGGYDTRPLATGYTDVGIPVVNKKTVFYQQAALEIEAISENFILNAYNLNGLGKTQRAVNSVFDSGSLNTYGCNAGIFLTPKIKALVGYYYQDGDDDDADGPGVKTQLGIEIAPGIELGGTYSYDEAFESRFSADLIVRFGGGSQSQNRKVRIKPQIKGLTATPSNRDVRVHDCCYG